MLGQKQMSFEEYVALFRRRRWLIIVPALLSPVIALGITFVLHSRYTSNSLILIEQQSVPASFVPPVITNDLNARVANMEEQIFSRTRLQPLVERYGLFRDDTSDPMEMLVGRLRKSIELTPVKPIVKSRDEVLPGFTISVTLDDPRVSQQVCAEITTMFIDENAREREQTAQGTTSFLDAQLQDAKTALNEQEAKLAEFKRKYLGELPEDTQTNLNILTTLNTQLQTVTESLNRTYQDKTYVESLLSQQVAAWKATQVTSGPRPETVDQQLAEMQNALLALQSQYTSDYPDVIRLKAAIAELKKKAQSAHTDEASAASTAKTQTVSGVEPADLLKLRSQLQAYDESIKAGTAEQKRLQAEIKSYESRIQMSPLVEQQYQEVTRNHQTVQDFYNELLAKKNQSTMATDLEKRQEGEGFRIMDPASLPDVPSFPNKPLFAGAGFGIGLALGVGLAFLLEMRDKALRTESDIEFYLGLPTLVRVPSIDKETPKNGSSRKRGKKPLSVTEGTAQA